MDFIILIVILIGIVVYYKYNSNNKNLEGFTNSGEMVLPDVYYINLVHRKDRKHHILNELNKIHYPKQYIHRIDAIKKRDGATGCGLSHIKALKLAKDQAHNHDYIMVLEDDFKWIYGGTYTLKVLEQALNQKVDWNVILLSCNGIYHKYNRYLGKVNNCQTASGYIIKTKYLDTLLKIWERDMDFRLRNNIDNKSKEYTETCIDQSWKRLQGDNWYITQPKLGLQVGSYSDIENGHVNYQV